MTGLSFDTKVTIQWFAVCVHEEPVENNPIERLRRVLHLEGHRAYEGKQRAAPSCLLVGITSGEPEAELKRLMRQAEVFGHFSPCEQA